MGASERNNGFVRCTKKSPLTYRDTIEMNSYGYKGILFEMNTAGTDLEGKKITYALGDWDK